MNRFRGSDNRVKLVCAVLALIVLQSDPLCAVTIDWAPVGNAGNAPDPATGGVGSVDHSFQIDKYDVTNTQYAEFLNAKDATGANALGMYNSNMGTAPFGGISFNTSSPAGSKYSVIGGDGNHPVTYVSWYDSIRFTNWLNNGQGNGDTETGAYTLLGDTPTPSNGLSITRNADAKVFLPNIDEWHKAAYYDPATDSYFKYATGSNTVPSAGFPSMLPNSANFNFAVDRLTNVGAYSATTSPYGAFDMVGNVWQWNEAYFSNSRILNGSYFGSNASQLDVGAWTDPAGASGEIGFRVASLPEPSTLVLAALGSLALLTCRKRHLSQLRARAAQGCGAS